MINIGKIAEVINLPKIILLAVLVRIVAMLVLVDLESENYWEYGDVARNIHAGNGYSLFYYDESGLATKFKEGQEVEPSAYMGPGYVMFLYPFLYIDNIVIRNVCIIAVQIIMSCLVLLALYRFCEREYGRDVGLIAIFIYAMLPEVCVCE